MPLAEAPGRGHLSVAEASLGVQSAVGDVGLPLLLVVVFVEHSATGIAVHHHRQQHHRRHYATD